MRVMRRGCEHVFRLRVAMVASVRNAPQAGGAKNGVIEGNRGDARVAGDVFLFVRCKVRVAREAEWRKQRVDEEVFYARYHIQSILIV